MFHLATGWRGSFFLLYIKLEACHLLPCPLCGESICETAEDSQEERQDASRNRIKASIRSRFAMHILFLCRVQDGFCSEKNFFFLFLPLSGLSADPYEVSHTQCYMLFQHEAYSTFERSYFRNDVICVYMVRIGKVRRRRKNYIYIHIKTWGFHWVEMPYKHIIVSKTEDLVKLENQR